MLDRKLCALRIREFGIPLPRSSLPPLTIRNSFGKRSRCGVRRAVAKVVVGRVQFGGWQVAGSANICDCLRDILSTVNLGETNQHARLFVSLK